MARVNDNDCELYAAHNRDIGSPNFIMRRCVVLRLTTTIHGVGQTLLLDALHHFWLLASGSHDTDLGEGRHMKVHLSEFISSSTSFSLDRRIYAAKLFFSFLIPSEQSTREVFLKKVQRIE